LEQSGLFSADADAAIEPHYLGSAKSVPSPVGRLNVGLNWADTHLVLHKGLKPVGSPRTQRFLTETAQHSENTLLDLTYHPVLRIQTPTKEVRPRVVPPQRRLNEIAVSSRRHRGSRGSQRQTERAEGPWTVSNFEEQAGKSISLRKLIEVDGRRAATV
jgi:hypothetical protein